MKKLIGILIIAFFFSSCVYSASKTESDESLTKEINGDPLVRENSFGSLLMTSSTSLEPSFDIQLYECDFSIVLNENGDTTHWSTNDDDFKTPEGYAIGTKWHELPMELQSSVNKIPGWGYYIKLNSDWQLGFCEGESCTDSKPKDQSRVKWIFKRND